MLRFLFRALAAAAVVLPGLNATSVASAEPDPGSGHLGQVHRFCRAQGTAAEGEGYFSIIEGHNAVVS